MIPTVFIAAMLVGKRWALPFIALTWIVPIAFVGSDEEIARALVLAPLNAYLGYKLLPLVERVLKRQIRISV